MHLRKKWTLVFHNGTAIFVHFACWGNPQTPVKNKKQKLFLKKIKIIVDISKLY